MRKYVISLLILMSGILAYGQTSDQLVSNCIASAGADAKYLKDFRIQLGKATETEDGLRYKANMSLWKNTKYRFTMCSTDESKGQLILSLKDDANKTVLSSFDKNTGKSYSFVDKDITPGKHKYRLKQIDLDGSYEYSDIIEAEVMQKLNYTLMHNYPHPFNPTTKIKFPIPSVETTRRVVFTTLKVYDILGNEIVTLVNEEKPAGNYNVIFDASKLSSGVYFYTLKTGEFSKTNKMILTK